MDESSQIKISAPLDVSAFGKALLAAEEDEDFAKAMALLKEMGPSAIDTEIR